MRLRLILNFLVAALAISATNAAEPIAEEVFAPGVDGVGSPTLIKNPSPSIPTILEREHLQARVQYYVHVKSDGSVVVKDVLSCGTRKRSSQPFTKVSDETCEPIDRAARTAVSQWRYKPAMKDGKAVSVGIGITVTLVPPSAH